MAKHDPAADRRKLERRLAAIEADRVRRARRARKAGIPKPPKSSRVRGSSF